MDNEEIEKLQMRIDTLEKEVEDLEEENKFKTKEISRLENVAEDFRSLLEDVYLITRKIF